MRLLEPRSLAEAHEQLSRGGAVLVAGGVGVGLRLRERSLPPKVDLVTLRRVEQAGLRVTTGDSKAVAIGALCTHAELARDLLLGDRLPGLGAVFGALGNHRVRSQGTIGGNLATADPNHDPAVALRALRASIRIDAAEGDRTEVVAAPGGTSLAPDEILTRVIVPGIPPGWRLHYAKLATGTGVDPGLVSVAVLGPGSAASAATDDDLAPLEVVVGCLGPVPLPLPGCATTARRFLMGLGSSADVQVAAAEELATGPAGAQSTHHRRHVAAVLIRRMVDQVARGVTEE